MKPERSAAERTESIFGEPPRLGPVTGSEFDDRLIAHAAKLHATTGTAPLASDVNEVAQSVRTLMRHPELYSRFSALSVHIFGSGELPARDREIAILRIAWLWGAPYPWSGHLAMAKKAGITVDEIDRITVGSSAADWTERDRAILQVAEELYADAFVSDTTWNVLDRYLDDRQLIELLVTVGHYTTVSFLMTSLRIHPDSGSAGLLDR